jgi:glycosyltransferase involved in cell wall biosynthesis
MDSEMKIGVNAAFLNEKPTGVGVFTREVTARLCKIRENTLVFASVPSGTVRKIQKIETPPGIRGSIRLSHNIMRFLYTNTMMPAIIKKHDMKVLFCPIPEFPFFGRHHLVVTVHDLHPVYFPRQFGLSAIHYKIALKLLSRHNNRVIVPSDFVRKELLRLTKISEENIDIVPLGYDSALFRPAGEDIKQDFLGRHNMKGPFILFVGSLFPYKNIMTLVKAFMNIKDRISHSLIIIGKKEVSSERLPEDGRIQYLDYVRKDDMPRFYSYADLLVHPSFVEGFGITILEAMACGTPVISSRGGSLPEIVGDAGILFDPEDGKALEEAILRVIHNKDLQRQLREKGLSRIERFSWDRTAEGVLSACEKVFRGMK